MNILDSYVLKPPSAQNVLDIFAGEWSSSMPSGSGLVTAPGQAELFNTLYIELAGKLFGGFRGRSVLELGPLEGAHSWMLQHAGADRVLAIEANTRAFLKCLCVKEIFGLDRVHYVLGDFMQHLEGSTEQFDITLASGVLYHMTEPMRLLDHLSKASDRIILWTHYYDETVITANPNLSHKFSPLQRGDYNGFAYDWVVQSYKESLEWAGFCGGGHETSVWLGRQSILNFLKARGFLHQSVAFDRLDHPNGPCFAVIASRTPMRSDVAAVLAWLADLRLLSFDSGDHSTNLVVASDGAAGLAPGLSGNLFVAFELGDEVHVAQQNGLRHFVAGAADDFDPICQLGLEAQSNPLSIVLPALPPGCGPRAVYVGVGDSFAQVIQYNSYVRLPI